MSIEECNRIYQEAEEKLKNRNAILEEKRKMQKFQEELEIKQQIEALQPKKKAINQSCAASPNLLERVDADIKKRQAKLNELKKKNEEKILKEIEINRNRNNKVNKVIQSGEFHHKEEINTIVINRMNNDIQIRKIKDLQREEIRKAVPRRSNSIQIESRPPCKQYQAKKIEVTHIQDEPMPEEETPRIKLSHINNKGLSKFSFKNNNMLEGVNKKVFEENKKGVKQQDTSLLTTKKIPAKLNNTKAISKIREEKAKANLNKTTIIKEETGKFIVQACLAEKLMQQIESNVPKVS